MNVPYTEFVNLSWCNGLPLFQSVMFYGHSSAADSINVKRLKRTNTAGKYNSLPNISVWNENSMTKGPGYCFGWKSICLFMLLWKSVSRDVSQWIISGGGRGCCHIMYPPKLILNSNLAKARLPINLFPSVQWSYKFVQMTNLTPMVDNIKTIVLLIWVRWSSKNLRYVSLRIDSEGPLQHLPEFEGRYLPGEDDIIKQIYANGCWHVSGIDWIGNIFQHPTQHVLNLNSSLQ